MTNLDLLLIFIMLHAVLTTAGWRQVIAFSAIIVIAVVPHMY